MAREAQRDPAGLSAGSARHALLRDLIDHAALFPPASLPMDAALEVDAAARRRPEAWMLGRFVVPASKLGDLPSDFAPALTVVLDTRELPPVRGRTVERVEARLESAAAVVSTGADGAERFLEVWPGHEDKLDAVAAAGASAKVRCGGATPEMFPSPGELAAFIVGCRARRLRFKATAGLHHPIRDGIVHGFLNLLAAAVLTVADGAGERELIEVLLEDDPRAFAVDDDALSVHGRPFGPDAIAAARRELFVGYGSCSFTEPVEDLRRMGIL
jgi:hypothetical protein